MQTAAIVILIAALAGLGVGIGIGALMTVTFLHRLGGDLVRGGVA